MSRSADTLLHLPVRLHGIQLGRPVDLLLDPSGRRALGFDVLCGDEIHRFLPFAASSISDDELAVDSPLVLLENVQSFRRRETRTLRGLLGLPVERRGQPAGALRDLVVDDDGKVQEVVVDAGGEVERLRPEDVAYGRGKAA